MIAGSKIKVDTKTGAAIWSKLTLGLLATITIKVVLFRAYAQFSTLLHFKMYPGSRVL
jgi:hypothetical protein